MKTLAPTKREAVMLFLCNSTIFSNQMNLKSFAYVCEISYKALIGLI